MAAGVRAGAIRPAAPTLVRSSWSTCSDRGWRPRGMEREETDRRALRDTEAAKIRSAAEAPSLTPAPVIDHSEGVMHQVVSMRPVSRNLCPPSLHRTQALSSSSSFFLCFAPALWFFFYSYSLFPLFFSFLMERQLFPSFMFL